MSIIKTIALGIITVLAFAFFTISPSQDAPSVDAKLDVKKVEVIYFHNTRRCATCNAIEKVAVGTLDKHYADMKKAGNVTFQSLNIEKEEGKKLADELGISEQSLIVTNGTKRLDLTNQAFMYARSKPDKLENLIKAAIKNLSK